MAPLRVAFLTGLLVTLLLVPGQPGRLTGTDAIGVFEITRSLREEGSLQVSSHLHAYVGRDGRRYSQFAVGQAVLALPLYEIGRLADRLLPETTAQVLAGPPVSTRSFVAGRRPLDGPQLVYGGSLEILAVSLYAPVATGVLAALFLVTARRLGASLGASVAASLLLGTCTYLGALSNHFLRHTTEAVLILGAFGAFFAWRGGGRRRDLLLGSALASAILLVRVPAAIAGVPLAVYLGACAVERRLWTLPRREQLRDAVAVLAPFLVAVAVHLALNYLRWGFWLESPMTAERARIGLPRADALEGYLVSPGASLFLYTPLLVLLPVTLAAAWRRVRRETLFVAGAALTFLLFYAGYFFWHGLWSAPGPRYLAPAIPLLMLPLALWLDEAGRSGRALVALLAAAGFLIQQALITTDFERLAFQEGYTRYQPVEAFLFEHSPALDSVRAFLGGSAWDAWLLKLAHGWEGVAPHPGLAVALLGAWLAATGVAAALLLRRLAMR